MTTFFLDLWQDLREKRLWPVAVGLLAAAAAIPAVMLKPASEPTPAPSVAATPDKAITLPAVDVDSSPTHGSKLETFSGRNPFKPLADLQKSPAGGSSAAPKTPGGSSTPSGGSPVPGIPATGASSGGSGGGSGAGSPVASDTAPASSGGGSSSSSTTTTPTQWFRYAADVSFGEKGEKATTHHDVPDFTLLPEDKNPVVMFLGVTNDGKTAVFELVDASTTASGEADCNDQSCVFFKLAVDDSQNQESVTTADGTEYEIELKDISVVKVKAPSSKTTASAKDDAGTSEMAQATQQIMPALMTLGAVGRK